jgi:hypothetical protein
MLTNKRDSHRRKLLSVLPRRTLEALSKHDKPATLKLSQLLTACVVNWDEAAVREAVERVIARSRVKDG